MITPPKHIAGFILTGMFLLLAGTRSHAQTDGSRYKYIFDMVEQQDYTRAKTELDRIPVKDVETTYTTTRQSATVKKPPPLFGWLLIPFVILDGLSPKTKEHRVYLLEYTVALEKVSPEKTEFVEYLLKRGANPNRAAGFKSPLAIAVAAGDNEMAKLLFRYGADPNAGFSGEKPLNIAFQKNNKELIRFFTENKVAFPEGVVDNGLIASALVSGDMELMDMLLKANVKFRGTELVQKIASISRNKKTVADSTYNRMVDKLVAYGLNPDETDRYTGNLPLHFALRDDCDGLALALVPHTSDINRQNTEGETPLMFAARHGALKVVAPLLRKGARTDMKNLKGETVRDIALKKGYYEVADLLESDDPAQRERSRALAYLLVNDSVDMKKKNDSALVLIRAGVSMDACRIRSYMNTTSYYHYSGPCSFLHFAVKKNYPVIAEALLINGADPNAKDPKDGDTPLKYALSYADTNMARILLRRGADVNNDPALKKQLVWYRSYNSPTFKDIMAVREMLMAETLKGIHIQSDTGGQYYADHRGRNIFSFRAERLTPFHPTGYATVKTGIYQNLIDITGNTYLAACDSIVSPEKVYDADREYVWLVRFKKHGLWSVQGLTDELHWNNRAYDSVSSFRYRNRRGAGYALCVYEGTYAFVDVYGRSPFPKYDRITTDKKGRIYGTVNGKRGRVKLKAVESDAP